MSEFIPFTPAERRIVPLLLRSLTAPEIAAELSISPKTVEGSLDKMREKTYSRNRVELALKLYRERLLTLGVTA